MDHSSLEPIKLILLRIGSQEWKADDAFILCPLIAIISGLVDDARSQSTDCENSKAFHNGLPA